MSTRYVPGSAAVLVGDRGLVATARDNADGLIALVDSDLVVLSVIDSLSHGSLAKLPDFACAVVDGEDLRIVVRGGFVAHVDGQSWSGQGVATWREHTLPGGAGSVVVLETEDVHDGPELPVTSGIVLASRATWTSVPAPATSASVASAPAAPGEEASSGVGAPAGPESAPEAADEPTAGEPPADEPAAEPAGEATAAGAPPSFPPPAFPPPPARPGPATPPPPPRHLDPELTVSESDLGLDTMFGATILGARPDGTDPAGTDHTGEGAGLPGDHDGRTITAAQLRALREQAAQQQPAVDAAIVLPDGARHAVRPRLLIGRRPQARQVATTDVPTLVTVSDPYVSSTHLEAAVVEGRLMVTDLSTNGTLITRPGQAPEQLAKGVATEVLDGTRLSLSDDLTVTVDLKAGG